MSDGTGVNTFAYDELNRLATETGQGSSSRTDYEYDPAGNLVRTEVQGEPTLYTYDARYRLQTLDGQRPGSENTSG